MFEKKIILVYVILYSSLFLSIFCLGSDQPLEVSKNPSEDSESQIIYSSVIIIHGECTFQSRYPDFAFPPGSWKEGEAQLTKRGKQQIYNLGKWCHERYAENLKTGYNHSYISADSTTADRTIMSAQVFLAGMLPPRETDMWASDGLKWQPVPVRSKENRIIDMIHGEKECPRYELEFVQMNKLPEIQALYKKHENLFEYMREHTVSDEWKFQNAPFYSIQKAWHLFNYFQGLKTLNMSIPEWGDKIYPEPLFSVGALHYSLFTHTHLMKRLEIGPLLKQIIKSMTKKTKDDTYLKRFHIYSTHRAILIGLLDTLGVYNGIVPEPGTAFLIELRKKDDKFIVTMTYKNSSTEPTVSLKLPRCDEICTLSKFSNELKSLTPKDWDEECFISSVDKMGLIYHHLWLIIIVGSILTISVLLCILRSCRARSTYEKLH